VPELINKVIGVGDPLVLTLIVTVIVSVALIGAVSVELYKVTVTSRY
jgi:hypothetical protein